MRFIRIICAAVSVVLYVGCLSSFAYPRDAAALTLAAASAAGADNAGFSIPEIKLAALNASAAEGKGSVKLDLSSVGKGYVAVSATSSHRLKFQVIVGDVTYNYDMPSDGQTAIFPLQSGNGTYKFRVMENVSASRYAEMYSSSCSVSLESEFSPFLVNSSYVPYSADSNCVKKSRELAEGCKTTVDVIKKIYDYICSTVTYDYDKAMTVKSGYMSDPDATMSSGKGICFDYSALAASMLRNLGIPVKMIFGYVAPDNVYHAWNMIYTTEQGWISADLAVKPKAWTRFDLTFSANGADGSFIGNGSNYADVYVY